VAYTVELVFRIGLVARVPETKTRSYSHTRRKHDFQLQILQ